MPETPVPGGSPPAIPRGVSCALDPRSIPLARLAGGIRAILLGLAVPLGFLLLGVGAHHARWALAAVLLWALLFPVLLWFWGWWWPAVEYRHASWRISEGGIEIRRGVLWRETVSVPRNRVQHTDVSQGPLERNFGLASLVIFTAGTLHAAVHLGGISPETARAIRDELLQAGPGDGV